jgi:hypothetical protein
MGYPPSVNRPPGYYENALWAYSDATSYAPGDTATFFVSSPVPDVDCTVSRAGEPEHTPTPGLLDRITRNVLERAEQPAR